MRSSFRQNPSTCPVYNLKLIYSLAPIISILKSSTRPFNQTSSLSSCPSSIATSHCISIHHDIIDLFASFPKFVTNQFHCPDKSTHTTPIAHPLTFTPQLHQQAQINWLTILSNNHCFSHHQRPLFQPHSNSSWPAANPNVSTRHFFAQSPNHLSLAAQTNERKTKSISPHPFRFPIYSPPYTTIATPPQPHHILIITGNHRPAFISCFAHGPKQQQQQWPTTASSPTPQTHTKLCP